MWDWQSELASVELVRVELSPEDVCHLAKHLPPDSPVLGRLEVTMREFGVWREPATA